MLDFYKWMFDTVFLDSLMFGLVLFCSDSCGGGFLYKVMMMMMMVIINTMMTRRTMMFEHQIDVWTPHDGGDCVTTKTPLRHPTVPLVPQPFLLSSLSLTRHSSRQHSNKNKLISMNPSSTWPKSWRVWLMADYDLTWEMYGSRIWYSNWLDTFCRVCQTHMAKWIQLIAIVYFCVLDGIQVSIL